MNGQHVNINEYLKGGKSRLDNLFFRKAMGKFATGVTVVTTKTEEGIHGMTANAFMSVSLEPKLVTISIDNKARMLDKIHKSKKFAISFLAEDQVHVSMHFAGQKKSDEEIEFEEIHNLPAIKGALATIACEVTQSMVVGDHTLFVGKVLEIKVIDGQPLTFYGGKYGRYQPLENAI